MAFPWLAAAAAGQAVLGALGGRKQRKAAEKESDVDRQMQIAFAKKSIRWRVADAKAAGLHPLFALGGNAATYTPQASQVDFGNEYDQLGQGVVRAAAAMESRPELELVQAQIENTRARTGTELAQQQLLASQAARLRGEMNATKASVVETFPLETRTLKVRDMEHFYDSAVVEPQVLKSRHGDFPIQQPFVNPGFMEVRAAGGSVLMPEATNVSEAFESMGESWAAMAATFNANVERYGRVEAIKRMSAAFVPNMGVSAAVSDLWSKFKARAVRAVNLRSDEAAMREWRAYSGVKGP